MDMRFELFQNYERFCVMLSQKVGQLESYCFIKSVALRLDAEFVKTTIEMSKMRHAQTGNINF